MKKLSIENPLVLIGLPVIALLIITAFFHHFVFEGMEVGEISGKVRSINQVPAGGTGRSIKTIDVASVILESGETIKVHCVSHCKIDQNLQITVYSPLFSNKVRYVYDRT